MRFTPIVLCFTLPLIAQHQHQHMHEGEPAEALNADLMHQGSGTSVNPNSSPMHMIHAKAGAWNLMFHGVAFLTSIQQTGPRGHDKLASMNWLMGMAERRAGRGSLTIRGMLSLDPATVTERRYPELFQTGETAYGRRLVDAQHPHDLFMELSVQYTRPLGEKTTLSFYAAPVGDPALGPVAFPHRVSAAELPQAALGHHLQDSTHIANEVITAGIRRGMFRLEASGFHGAEPDEGRWNIDRGGLDSWSTRLTVTPSNNWSGQISVGRLTHPEALDPGDIVRSTASVTYNRPLPAGNWATSFIWGRNYKTSDKHDAHSGLVESLLQFRRKNYLTGRIEVVDKDELFANAGIFRIAACTLGYTRDVNLVPGVRTGFGGNFTLYTVPDAIQRSYGEHPAAFLLYLRVAPK
jgi:hypothetical protein